MASIIRQFTVTVPANTPKATPVTLPIAFPSEQTDTLEIEVPVGPYGLMGFYLAMSGQQIIPFESGEFIVWNGVEKSWPLNNYPTSGAWSLVGYNLSTVNDHDVFVRFHNNPVGEPSQPVVNITIVQGEATGEPMLS